MDGGGSDISGPNDLGIVHGISYAIPIHGELCANPRILGSEGYFWQECPSCGGLGVRILRIKNGSRLNGLAYVYVHGVGRHNHFLKVRVATYFKDSAKKHWWQFLRYRYIGDVLEEMKELVKREIAKDIRSAENLKMKEEKLVEVENRTKKLISQFHSGVSVAGALSEADDIGGEVSVVENGAVSFTKKYGSA